ncbi:MAG: SRPBCC domain-containing protein [Pirellulales bacterium]
MTRNSDPRSILSHSRVLPFPVEQVFEAYRDPTQLSRWWGPAGFRNTFEVFEFMPDGRWIFVMHGPNGVDYANECRFRIIEPCARIVIEHVVEPWFQLTATMSSEDGGTLLRWEQEFESPEMAERVRAICGPANEENFDRLTELLRSRNS